MLALSSNTQLAKLTPPRLSRVAPRNRLFERLDFCRRRSNATWLTSPPGSGKTSAVAKYLQMRKLPTLWYQVDDGDGDIASFFYYLGLAVNQFSDNPQPMPLLTPEYRNGGVPVFARNFFRKLFSKLPQETILVFDNFQEAPEDSIQELVQIALEELPEKIHIFVISRVEPPPQFARFRTDTRMGMLGWDELKLTEEETFAVAQLQGQHALSETTIRLLHRETQGWMAGLVLLLNHTEQSLMHWQQTKSHELIFEFFAGEIFLAANKELQAFLLQSAFLPSMTLAAATALTGQEKAEDMLASLIKRNYFTSRLSNEQGSYEYHPLFRSFLLNKARQLYLPEQLNEVQRRAAEVLIKDNQYEAAVHLLLKARDWPHAVEIILQLAKNMLSQGRSQTLEHWIAKLPDEQRHATPWLDFWLAKSKLNRDPYIAQEGFKQAYHRFSLLDDVKGLYLAWHGIVECVWYTQSDATTLDEWLVEFEKLHKKHAQFPDPEAETCAVMSLLYVMYSRQPQHPDINSWADRAQKLWYQSSDSNLRLHLGVRLAYYYGLTGSQLAKAQEFCTTQEQLAQQKQLDPLAVIFSKAMGGFVHLFSGNPQQSLTNVKEALSLSEQCGIHIIDPMLLGIGAYASLQLQDSQESDQLLLRLCAILSDRPVNLDTANYQMLLAWRALLDQDVSRGIQHAESAVEISAQMGAVYPMLLCRLGLAQIYFEKERVKEAQQELDVIRKQSQTAEFHWLLYHVDLTAAYFSLAKKTQETSYRYLRKALHMASQRGFGLPLWYRPRVMNQLYSTALEQDIEPAYVRKRIKQCAMLPDLSFSPPDSWPWPIKVYTLGRFGLFVDDQPLESNSKGQRKPLELLQAVIALGGKQVSDNTLCDYLWPDAEGDSVRRSFDTNLHRLRKLIKHDKALIHKDFKLSLNPQYCWVDTWAFKKVHNEIIELLKPAKIDEASLIAKFNEALKLYQGSLLHNDTEEHWVYAEREKLQKRAINILSQIGVYFEKHDRIDEAVSIYSKGLELEPLTEAFYQRLIDIHRKQGHFAEAMAIYEQCKETLLNALGIHPSPVTEKLVSALKKNSIT